jgi:hypothetical protein
MPKQVRITDDGANSRRLAFGTSHHKLSVRPKIWLKVDGPDGPQTLEDLAKFNVHLTCAKEEYRTFARCRELGWAGE